ncbi:mannose-1-phosphate guanylyltransferase/mannose-6-phosphate isomerase [Pararobbsia silviterrae]|uniref:mannose-1-phosphate guanylyltransferase n=1 Tax=Pararobbsia silviterrae TaxID=1792498 RepID=A0A494YAG9_9BURK|nr:mannose-1-phosphate guanylyltransferase/mannose-6-phosphate isomerase [Pararobbsia silviterrae]RKP59416.1 mannose-1-phosphate guanylyltransferase/mannose-6-phosphate isomerase [Pararobbsia silviterrae]
MHAIEALAGQTTRLVPVIICGGAGTRLWPVSREAFPKPLMRLEDGQSLLQKTFLRACRLPGVSEIMIVTNRETYFLAKDDCRETGVDDVTVGFVLEPVARNTAPAIGAAALAVRERHGDDATMLVLPADHLIHDLDAFEAAVARAAQAAQAGRIVTFGIAPTRPETGYGYIEVDAPIASAAIHDVSRFVEKPSADIAEMYVHGRKHLWNAGMFCFRPDVILDALDTHASAVSGPIAQAVARAARAQSDDGYSIELDPMSFKHAENVSIDYAVMERASNVAVVPCDIGWSDIGSWQAISELTKPDTAGNRVQGAVSLHDVENCFIRGETRMIGALGIHDLIIVDTPDALLVASRDRAEDVKQIVARLKTDGHQSCKLHRTVHRPWGTYTVLEEGERFKMKRIVVKPGASLSLQMHHHRSEHWIVVSGCAEAQCGDRVIALQPNESTYIPAGDKHRLTNPGVLDLVLIEVQCGEYLGEDDIVRFQDMYGRLPELAPAPQPATQIA